MKNRANLGYEIKAKSKDSGEIFIYDIVGDPWDGTTAKGFKDDLDRLGPVKTLDVFINSPGGSVFDGTAIANQIERHAARKVVHIDGLAASIASVIAMAGDTINIARNALMMIHDPWAFAIGTAADMRKMADSLDKVRDAILNTYVARTNGDPDTIRQMMAEETWFGAEEAVAMGFADTITGEVAMAAHFDLSKFKHPPAALVEAMATAAPDAPEDPDPAAPPGDPTERDRTLRDLIAARRAKVDAKAAQLAAKRKTHRRASPAHRAA